ncbi:dihydrofolate reductase family protein [Ilumatobacter sp.]|uniref:dihydrofolate reductase family protein n=1 Tax=Ilumatobacter sp. TaxID=1967498 RepID=UPI003B526A81
MRRLLPTPSDTTTVADAYASALGTRADVGGERPWIWATMVQSLDGSTVVDGTSGALSSDTDSAVLLQLRSIADVVLVGSGTASGEGYGPPSKEGQRIGVVTGRGSVDTSDELFTSGAGFVITTETATFDERGVDVLRCGRDEVDLLLAAGRLDEVCATVDLVQLEGGPSLNGAMSDADLVDEWNVSTSPAVVGGGGPRLVTGASDLDRRLDLVQLALDDDSFVFSRWRRRREPSSP